MATTSRRRFLQGVGSGMLVAGLGSNLAVELGVASEADLRPGIRGDYGPLGSWVTRM